MTVHTHDRKDKDFAEIIPSQAMKQLLNSLCRELERLPELEREIVILYFYFNLSPNEISQKVGISCDNVHRLCALAQARLQSKLNKMVV